MGKLVFALAIAALAVAAAPPPPKKKAPARRETFAALRDRYVKTFFGRFPVVATFLGASGLDRALGRLDGKLRDYRPEALARERSEWERFRAALARVDRKALT